MPFKGDSGLADGMSPAYRARAARYALRPLYRGRIDSKEKTVQMMLALRKRWVALSNRMAKDGWEAANTDAKLSFMLGCPAFGVNAPKDPVKHQVLRPCDRFLVCPFCYARKYPLNAFDRLWPVIEPGGRVLVATENTVEVKVEAAGGFAEAADLVRRHIISSARLTEVGTGRHHGAVVFHRVRVVDRKQQVTALKVERTALIVRDPVKRLRIKVLSRSTTSMESWSDPTKKDLAAAVGRAFAYPAEWYDQTTETLTTLMTALSRARVFAAYGDCRRSAETES